MEAAELGRDQANSRLNRYFPNKAEWADRLEGLKDKQHGSNAPIVVSPPPKPPGVSPENPPEIDNNTLGKYRLNIGAIYLNNLEHDFTGFDQRLSDDASVRNRTISLDVRTDIPFFNLPNIDTFVGGDLMRLSTDYDGHINISTGTPGASSGNIKHTYLGAIAKFEDPVTERGSIGVSPGLGVLFPNVSGTYEIDDPVVAAKGELYYLQQITERFGVSADCLTSFPSATVREALMAAQEATWTLAPSQASP